MDGEFCAVDPSLSDEEYEELRDVQTDESGCILNEGIDMREVLQQKGCIFQARMSEEAAQEELQVQYDPKEVFEKVLLHPVNDEEEPFIPEGETFEKVAEKMFDLTPDGKVKKRIVKEGYGDVVPPNALVWFHHNSYYEACESPFDSSYLRGIPIMRRLGVNQCIPGLEIGLRSMKAGEKAWFLVHYDYAYKKMGVPPRIPPESDILFQVEMKKFLDNESAVKIGEAEEEELKRMEFLQVYQATCALVEDANVLVKQKKYESAVKLYRKALRCLERVEKKNDEEEQKFVKMEVKINTNLAIILNRLGEHQKAITATRNAIYYKSDNAKAYYQLSMAHLSLGSHDKAKESALFAKRLEPRNPDIVRLLTKIDKNQQLYEKNSVAFARNMFGFGKNKSGEKKQQPVEASQEKEEEKEEAAPAEPTDENVNVSEEFKLTVIDYIEDFLSTEGAKEAPLASTLSYDEEKFVRQQARNYKIMIRVKEGCGGRFMYLSKE